MMINDWYSTSLNVETDNTVDSEKKLAVAVVGHADGHRCLCCCGDCHHCIGLIIIILLHLNHCHCAPSPWHDPPPPIGPVAGRCGRGWIRPWWPHQKCHPCQGNKDACTCRLPRWTPMSSNWHCSRLKDEWHCHRGRRCLPLPSCLTLYTPPHILTLPPTMHPPLHLTVIVFFLVSPPKGCLPANPPFLCYSYEGHIIYHENPQRLNFLIMKKIVVVSIVSRDYSEIFCNQQ